MLTPVTLMAHKPRQRNKHLAVGTIASAFPRQDQDGSVLGSSWGSWLSSKVPPRMCFGISEFTGMLIKINTVDVSG